MPIKEQMKCGGCTRLNKAATLHILPTSAKWSEKTASPRNKSLQSLNFSSYDVALKKKKKTFAKKS